MTAGRVRVMLAAVTGTLIMCGATVPRGTGWLRILEPGLRMWAEPPVGIWNVTARRGLPSSDRKKASSN